MQQLKLGNNQKNILKRKQLRVPTFIALTNGALSNLVDASAHPVGKKEKMMSGQFISFWKMLISSVLYWNFLSVTIV